MRISSLWPFIARPWPAHMALGILLGLSSPLALADGEGPTAEYNRENEFTIVDMNTEKSVVFRVDYKDPSGIDLSSVSLTINGEEKTASATVKKTYIELKMDNPPGGLYHAELKVSDKKGNQTTIAWDVMYQQC